MYFKMKYLILKGELVFISGVLIKQFIYISILISIVVAWFLFGCH